MAHNPDAATKNYGLPDAAFVPNGRGVPAGNGWRWIADTWTFMGAQRSTFIGVSLLLCLMQLAVSLVPTIGPIVVNFVVPPLLGGFILGCDAARRGELLEVGHLFMGFERRFVGRLLVLGTISCVVGIGTGLVFALIVGPDFTSQLLGGTLPSLDQLVFILLPLLLALLVILALSLPVSMAMLFAPPLIVLGGADVLTALKTSFVVCLKNAVPFLVWSVVILGLAIPATIPLALGWLLLVPVLMVSLYLSYHDIFYAP